MEQQTKISSNIIEFSSQFRVQLEDASVGSVEEFLARSESAASLQPGQRKKLIASLIREEILARRSQGDSIDVDDYAKRFPDFDLNFFEELVQLPELPTATRGKIKLPSKYIQLSKIGEGGVGIVWRTRDQTLERSVAIKTIKPKLSGNSFANQRLTQEAVITGQLQHPGIPPVYEQGILEDGDQYFAMKIVEGQHFGAILKDNDRGLPNLIGIFEQIAQTIAFAHANGVIHRDIKPQNVMVGEFGEVQVMDWGMAKQLGAVPTQPKLSHDSHSNFPSTADTVNCSGDESLGASIPFATKQGDIFGTPAYMSPEQARGDVEAIDQRSDVFSLGHLLFEILTGERVFAHLRSNELIEHVAQGKIGAVGDRLSASDTNEELQKICVQCLQPDAKDRPKNAQVVAEAISNYQTNYQERLKQAEVEKSEAVIRETEQKKRTRLFGWMSGLVALVSILGTIAFASQAYKASKAAKLAQLELETRTEISNFLVIDLFEQASPFENPNPDVKLRTVLNRARSEVSKRFHNRPSIELQVRLQLSEMLKQLGEYKYAKEQIVLALPICESLHGTTADEAWDLRLDQIELDIRLQYTDLALEMADETIQFYEQENRHNAAQSLSAQELRASALHSLGRFQESVLAARSLLANPAASDKELVSAIYFTLASAELELENFEASQAAIDKIFESLESDNVLDVGQLLNEKAEIQSIYQFVLASNIEIDLMQSRERKFAEAELKQKQLADKLASVVGENHPLTVGLIHNLAMSKMRQNKFQEVLPVLEKILPISETQTGETSDLSIRIRNSLAACYHSLDKETTAMKLLLELEDQLSKRYDSPNHNTIANAHNLGEMHCHIRNYEQSEEYLKKALRDSTEVFGEKNSKTNITRASLAATHGYMKNYKLAESEFVTALANLDETIGETHPDTIFTLELLRKFYFESDQTEKEYESLKELVKRKRSNQSDAKLDSVLIGRLGKACYRTDRFEEACPLLIQSHEFFVKKYGATSRKTLLRFLTLIKTEFHLERFESANQRLNEKMALLAEVDNEFMYQRLNSMAGKAELEMGNMKVAEEILLESGKFLASYLDKRKGETKFATKIVVGYLIELYEKTGNNQAGSKWNEVLKAMDN